MEAHHPGDHIPGLPHEFEWHQHSAGGFVIPLHMVGAGSGDVQNIKLGIWGILLTRMCSEVLGGAVWISYSQAPAVLGFSWLSDLGPLGGEGASGWAEVGGWKVLFLLWSAEGTLQCCKNEPDCSANKAKKPKTPHPNPLESKTDNRKTVHSFSWKDTVSDLRIKTSCENCPGKENQDLLQG